MKIQIFALYDSAAQIYGQPMFILNKGYAVRGFQELANNKSDNVGKHPADFTLFHIGEYEDTDCTIKMFESKVSCGTALEYVNKDGLHAE